MAAVIKSIPSPGDAAPSPIGSPAHEWDDEEWVTVVLGMFFHLSHHLLAFLFSELRIPKL